MFKEIMTKKLPRVMKMCVFINTGTQSILSKINVKIL